jgi:hypothetical protein
MVSNLTVPGVSNAAWQTTPLRQTWMSANNVSGMDIDPNAGTVALTFVSCGSLSGSASAILPYYLVPMPTKTIANHGP